MIELPPLPPRMAHLPRDSRGYPVPWFVHIENGVPDFRIIGPGKIADALRFERCWVCGQQRGRNLTFVIGPMCAINRITSEPPSHYDCALFSALACPMLTRPRMKRNTVSPLPEGGFITEPAGVHFDRNPGGAVLWTCRKFSRVKLSNGSLFQLGPPDQVDWYVEGRKATRAEALGLIEAGVPVLEGMCDKEEPRERDKALGELATCVRMARELVPAC